MAFTENQLEIWSHQGATASSATTYNSIKTCLDGINWNDDVKYKIYLQGSYKNSTNIRANSDVDVIIEFTSIFHSNKESLSSDMRQAFDEYYSDGKYTLTSFKAAVLEGLNEYYGKKLVDEGNRAIKVQGANGRLDADVVCCCTYRRYSSFSRTNMLNYVEGIEFLEKDTSQWVVSYPNLHFDNGASKNSTCKNNYKPTTRIFKKLKANLIDRGDISNDLAPSYFIECLLYNVPNLCFLKTNHYNRTFAVLEFLSNLNTATLEGFYCQNGRIKLFGTGEQQWDTDSCLTFIGEVIKYWNE